mmetsp:Transcript_22183/g.31803  ORF Transcript_22183/g.31803 Transcript_22183/m.31803 type:complete len:83 (+) Transcript_22183:901-1149(+)
MPHLSYRSATFQRIEVWRLSLSTDLVLGFSDGVSFLLRTLDSVDFSAICPVVDATFLLLYLRVIKKTTAVHNQAFCAALSVP